MARYIPFRIEPTVSFEQAVTDNVNVTSTGKQFDTISTVALDFGLTEQTRRTSFRAAGSVNYQKFFNQSDFDGAGLALSSIGQAELIDRFLFFDTHAAISDRLINNVATPATGRASGIGQTRIVTWDAGPFVTTTFADLIDVSARARYAEIAFDDIGNAPIPASLNDSSIKQAGAVLTTGEHIRKYEMRLSGEYLEQNQGFKLSNVLYSLYLGDVNGLRLIGRAGYEQIEDPGITDISEPIWSGGVSMRRGATSFVSVEYGRRYGKPVWNVSSTLLLTPKLYLTGSYTRVFETEQSRLQRSLTSVFSETGEFPLGVPILPGDIQTNLVNGTFLSDNTNFGLSWIIDAPRAELAPGVQPGQNRGAQLSIIGGISDLKSVNTNSHEKDTQINVIYEQAVARRVSFSSSLGFSKTDVLLPTVSTDSSYRAQIELDYQLTERAAVRARYTRQRNNIAGGLHTIENVVSIGISRSF